MKIKKIETALSPEKLSALLDAATKEQIKVVNWPSVASYCPQVEFSILHDGDNIYIKYWVKEQATLAHVTKDFGEVWTDSCVEFFISFGTGYYNIEFNSIGYGLASFRTRREPEFATAASSELMAKIERYPSLHRTSFDEQCVEEWNIMLKLPKELFINESLATLDGVKATANFYKCGDNLTVPHFVSWNPIEVETPNFHIPSFFKEIEFANTIE
ncbi:MAG: carbohydrate-binding family 9-like protein [Rikenellaceae bacterium]